MAYIRPLVLALSPDAVSASCCTPFITITVGSRRISSGCYIPPAQACVGDTCIP